MLIQVIGVYECVQYGPNKSVDQLDSNSWLLQIEEP